MFEVDDENDPLTSALSSRRIKHSHGRKNQRGGGGKGKSKGGGGGGGSGGIFDPLRTLGRYDVQLGSNSKRSKQNQEAKGGPASWLEIHELTEGDDGLIGSFSFHDGQVAGICVLAGSRKGLASIVEDLERVDAESDDEDEPEVDGQEEAGDDDDDDDDLDVDNTTHKPSALEAADAKHNRRIQNFEKNSFRNPKFWLRWKGHVHPHPPTPPTETTETETETEMGYVVFTSNDCDRFDGTITCPALGWDNVKMQGWKSRSKPTPCSVAWADF